MNPRFIHLSLIVVDRDYHQMNIGSRLLERIETYCQDFECQYIELVSIPDRKVKEFYKKKGYIQEIGGYRHGFLMKYFERKTRPRSDHYPYRLS
jgi:GNAT superfamily N-acetyltransferase